MTKHLSPDERIDALDGALPASRQAHVDGCETCRQDLAVLREMADELSVTPAGDVPEPSPLFWDHFQARVSAAVDAAERAPWWRGSSRAWLVLATAAAVLLAVWISPLRPRDTTDMAATPHTDVAMISETVQWEFMSGVLESLEHEAARAVLEPSPVAVDAAFESLSAAERDAFVRLLQADMEGNH